MITLFVLLILLILMVVIVLAGVLSVFWPLLLIGFGIWCIIKAITFLWK